MIISDVKIIFTDQQYHFVLHLSQSSNVICYCFLFLCLFIISLFYFFFFYRINCILADEMGLGKTVQSISLLCAMKVN